MRINIDTLPIGTRFYVINGNWVGNIIRDFNGKKVIKTVVNTIKIKEDSNMGLDIIVNPSDEELDFMLLANCKRFKLILI